MADVPASEHVPTWRDGVVLPVEERRDLTEEQWRQFSDESVVRDVSEIDQMPEPTRAWARNAVDRARDRAEERIARQGSREAS